MHQLMENEERVSRSSLKLFKIIEMQQSVRTFINEGSELVKGTHNEKHAGFAQALYFAGLEADDYLLKLEYRAEAAFRITDAEIDVGRGKVEAVQQCLANLRTSIASDPSSKISNDKPIARVKSLVL
ncbi:unnamed protein product [Caenorhabditis bovis]|uniref:Uncharacterized protein n=1 Tax=Caenorhabditis bovis TaxID=2654633 RepID=A0A8S1EPV6_9PELO|nr:unnamed protein product [Caenorhabditis bovis]